MVGRWALTMLILALLLIVGCSRDGVMGPETQAPVMTDDSGGDLNLMTPPQEQETTWSELKRKFADRPPKDN
jgi:hypothetical protein